KVRYPELNKFPDRNYHRIFHVLESETEYWQQALAIRIYFEFHAPLTRILSAEWNQIVDQQWYPYSPEEKEFWFECREKIEKDARKILDRIQELSSSQFNKSSYWFPTKFGRKHSHIRSVEHVWRVTLRKCGMQYYPLREFSRSYREF